MTISRRTGSGLTLAPVLAAVLLAGLAIRPETTIESPCWLLVAQRAAVALPAGGSCPLEFLDTVVGVESAEGVKLEVRETLLAPMRLAEPRVLQVIRAGEALEATLEAEAIDRFDRALRALGSLLIAFSLMWIPTLLYRGSEAAAAPPLAIFYSAVVVVAITTIGLRDSQWMTMASAAALMIAPAALVHLSFFFPRERPIVTLMPGIVRFPYFVVPVLIWIAVFSLQDPLVLLSFVYLLLFLYAAAWFVLMSSAYLTFRESQAALPRARARTLFYGALVLPVLPAAFAAPQFGVQTGMWVYLACAPLALPLPVGFAISRYNLFDIGFDLRFLMVRTLYIGFGAFVISGTGYAVLGVFTPEHPLRDMGLLFSIALGCAVAIEVARRPLLGLLVSALSPRLDQLSRLRESFHGNTNDLNDADAIAALTANALEEGLQASSGCVLLLESSVWRAVAPFGRDAPLDQRLASDAVGLAGARAVVQLPALEGEKSAEFRRLEEAGIHLVLPITTPQGLQGVALVCATAAGETYAGREVEFAVQVTQAAAQALHNTQVADERAEEKHETLHGLWSILFVHRIGKNLLWTQKLVRKGIGRATRELEDDEGQAPAERIEALERELELLTQLEELTEPMSRDVQVFLNDAMERRKIPHGHARIEETLELVVRRVDDDRVRKSTDPELGRLVCHEFLGDAVLNLVQNALRETPENGQVQIRAERCDDGQVAITVSDEGSGIPEEMLEAVFEAGYTTNPEGAGVGLSTSRDLVHQLGGEIKLERREGGGTLATITIPPVDISEGEEAEESEAPAS